MACALWGVWGHPRRPPGPLGGSGMFLGHCGLIRHCVLSSVAAHAASGGRCGRLLDLKARRSDVERTTRGADPVGGHEQGRRSDVEQAATTASGGRVSGS